MHLLQRVFNWVFQRAMMRASILSLCCVYCVNMERTNINDACYGEKVVTKEDATCEKRLSKYIFMTTASYTGNLGGLTGADAKCNADAAKPNGSTYRAHLYHGTGTIAGDTSNLSAAYDYKNTGNAEIISGEHIYSGVPLGDLINRIDTGSANVWFGNSTDNCTNWTSNSNSIKALTGSAGATWYNWYRDSDTLACNNLFRIYCVEN